jgi:hypothetical protein
MREMRSSHYERTIPDGDAPDSRAIRTHHLAPASNRGAVTAWIACALDSLSTRMHDGTGMPHGLIERGDAFDGMPRRLELGEKLSTESALQAQGSTRFSPGAAEQPTGGGDRFLKILAVESVARKKSGLCLWLTVAPHRAVHHGASVRESRKGRVQCVEGFAPRRQHIGTAAAEPECAPAVLPYET